MNTHYNLHHRPRSIVTGEWRYEAKCKAIDAIGWDDTPFVNRAMALIKVYTPHEGPMDIHNVHVKPLFDGFSSAGLWVDDEWAFLPLVLTIWTGNWAAPKGLNKRVKTVIEVHELESITYNNMFMTLPKGRTWLKKNKSVPILEWE